jgi:hypothetical protein
MSGAFGLAGWHFSSNPTSSSSENKVGKADNTEPWKTGRDAQYQYHPHGDPSKPRKDAPSALNEVIIPNVNLPKVSLFEEKRRHIEIWKSVLRLEEDGNWINEDELLTFDCSRFTRSTTSGARRASKRLVVSERGSCVNIKSFEGRIERFSFVYTWKRALLSQMCLPPRFTCTLWEDQMSSRSEDVNMDCKVYAYQ